MNNNTIPDSPNSHTGANDQAPPDPSNTSNVGQKVEQGVINIKEGISEQSGEWEDKLERTIPEKNAASDKAENYLKNPSPEERNLTDNSN